MEKLYTSNRQQMILLVIFGNIIGIALLIKGISEYDGFWFVIASLIVFCFTWFIFIGWKKQYQHHKTETKKEINLIEENRKFYVINPVLALFLSILTLGLYRLYWWYRQWEYAKEFDSTISPGWRTFFNWINAFKFNQHLKDRYKKANAEFPENIALLFAVINITSVILPTGFIYIFFTQSRINRISAKKEEKSVSRSALKFSIIIFAIGAMIGVLQAMEENDNNLSSYENANPIVSQLTYSPVILGGDPVQIGSSSFSFIWFDLGEKVTSAEVPTTYDYLYDTPTSISGRFVSVVLSGLNTGNVSDISEIKNVKLIDANGRNFTPIILSDEINSVYDENRKIISLGSIFGNHTFYLQPGLKDKVAFIFEIPKDVSSTSLSFDIKNK